MAARSSRHHRRGRRHPELRIHRPTGLQSPDGCVGIDCEVNDVVIELKRKDDSSLLSRTMVVTMTLRQGGRRDARAA